MNIEHKTIFIKGLDEWKNQLIIRKGDIITDISSDINDNARRIYLKEKVEKINEMIFNIKQEKEKQEKESKHYTGV